MKISVPSYVLIIDLLRDRENTHDIKILKIIFDRLENMFKIYAKQNHVPMALVENMKYTTDYIHNITFYTSTISKFYKEDYKFELTAYEWIASFLVLHDKAKDGFIHSVYKVTAKSEYVKGVVSVLLGCESLFGKDLIEKSSFSLLFKEVENFKEVEKIIGVKLQDFKEIE